MGVRLLLRSCLALSLLLQVVWQWQWQWNHGCYGCQDEERRALLDIKSAFDTMGPEPASKLESWVSDGNDCCSWDRVRCGSITGRVVRLDLHAARPLASLFSEPDGMRYLPFTLNATLFLPFQELHSLILSNNVIIGCLADAGFESWSKLSKLEYLDLSYNAVEGATLPSLGAIKSLKALSLQANLIELESPIHALATWSRLSELEYLDLSRNSFNESIIQYLPRKSSLKTLLLMGNNMVGRLPVQELSMLDLEVLDLSDNEFDGSIPAMVEEWTSLKALSLSSNMFSGIIPTKGLCSMKNLQELDLSKNNLTGVLPSCLGNLTSVKLLDVSNNQLQADFPSSIIANLTSLEYLSLSNNQFEGVVLLSIFSNHSKLKLLELADNKLDVETEYSTMLPKFQLEVIKLSNCNLNKESGAIPKFLSTQYALKSIDLSYNQLRGHIPKWLLQNKTSLADISLQNNQLSGPFLLPYHLNTSMSLLDVSKNKLNGEIPTNLGTLFPNLVYLNISANFLHGGIPLSFSHMSQLEIIDLSNNNLSGQITNDVFGNMSSLSVLSLSNNKFHGRILSNHSSMPLLSDVLLDRNLFTGEFPTSLCNGLFLTILDISENLLYGKLPNCIGDLSRIAVLKLEGNDMYGHIPINFCNLNSLEYLDLSRNHLSGSLPTCVNQSNLQYLHLNNNHLKGFFPINLFGSPDLVTIDIRNNHLSGKLPKSMWGSLLMLRVLLLKGNRLEGSIPNQMCSLKFLRILDLSHNDLSGGIPSCFNRLGYEDAAFDTFVYFSSALTGKGYSLPSYTSLLPEEPISGDVDFMEVDQLVYTTKRETYFYKGDIIGYFSGLDLSCNQLAGNIPLEIGSMSWLLSVNLSNNLLSGPIPPTFSNLKELESLDLSHNHLTGPIPHELVELHYLGVFSVAYNNLSGPTIGEDSQFSTFDQSSYEGNPNLCGYPLEKKCFSTQEAIPMPLQDEVDDDEHREDATDHLIFFASVVMSFVLGFWGFIAVFYFKTEWRYALLRSIDSYSEAVFMAISGLKASRR